MAYISNDVSRQKLMILFFLKEMGAGMTREQLYRVMAENDWMNYFDYQSTMLELEEDGFLAAVPRPFGQAYALSAKGDEALSMFQAQLPHSLRQAMSAYVEENGETLRREAQYSIRQQQQPDGTSRLELKVLDGAAPVLEITFSLPDQEMAARACANWPSRAEMVFREMLTKLLN